MEKYLGYKEFFKTLGNETRIAILLELKNNGRMNVSELTKAIEVDQSTISHNLKRLEQCHFVEVKPSGQERFYELNKVTINKLLKIIDEHVDRYCKKACCK